jgi:hypothetical protein
VLLLALLIVLAWAMHVVADEEVPAQRVSTLCQLQRALADCSVVHVVVTEHLYFDASANCGDAGAVKDRGQYTQSNSSTGSSARDSSLEQDAVDCVPLETERTREKDSSNRGTDGSIEDDPGVETPCDEDMSGRDSDDDTTESVEVELLSLPLLVNGARKTIRVWFLQRLIECCCEWTHAWLRCCAH